MIDVVLTAGARAAIFFGAIFVLAVAVAIPNEVTVWRVLATWWGMWVDALKPPPRPRPAADPRRIVELEHELLTSPPAHEAEATPPGAEPVPRASARRPETGDR